MRLRNKFLVGYLLITLVGVACAGALLLIFQRAHSESRALSGELRRVQSTLNELYSATGTLQQILVVYTLSAETDAPVDFSELDTQTTRLYDMVQALGETEWLASAALDRFTARLREYLIFTKRLLGLHVRQPGRHEEHLRYLVLLHDDLREAKNRLAHHAAEVFAEKLKGQDRSFRLGVEWSLGAIMLSVFASMLLSNTFTRRMMRPLSKTMQAVDKLARGDLSARTGVTGSDELEALALSVDAMAEKIAHAEQSMRNLFHASEVGFIKNKISGEPLMINKGGARMLGYDSPEEYMADLDDFNALYVNPDLREWLVGEVRAGRFVGSMPVSFRRRDGAVIHVEMSVHGVRDRYGELASLEGIMVDKTMEGIAREMRRKREIAEEANKAKSLFLAMVSHEMRTPLNSIVGMSGVLRDCRMQGAEGQCVDVIHEASNVLYGLIANILDMSQIEAGELVLSHESMDLREIVRSVCTIFSSKAESKGIELRCDTEALGECRVLGDGDRLRQILLNLVGNAMKFTDAGSVTLAVRGPGTDPDRPVYAFRVEDTGTGIPAEALDGIFEQFKQVEDGEGRYKQGTGLGLAISKRLSDLMGGDLSVRSIPGMGSTFLLSVPFEAEGASQRRDFPN